MTQKNSNCEIAGVLLVNKPKGKTAFSLVACLRRILGVKKIGHAGTLDPFATGVMVMLIGKSYTKLSDTFLCADKEYIGCIKFGESTDTFDCDGVIVKTSDIIPTRDQLEKVLLSFQGEVEQVPPMYSAKKIDGKKLYELARQGKTVERKAVKIVLRTDLVSYDYPYATIAVKCSKGTYIRCIANDIGDMLGCGGHLVDLLRVRSGAFRLENCFDGQLVTNFVATDLPELREKIKLALIHSADKSE
jgi:tRNA pseudouridine55 synthase